jgi:hypothetical protein
MSKSLPKIKKVEVSDVSGDIEAVKTLTVKKMPLGRYAAFWVEVAKIPETIGGLVKALMGSGDMQKLAADLEETLNDPDAPIDDPVIDFMLKLPGILAAHWGDLISIVSIATGIEEEELNQIDVDEAVNVIMAAIEVNNFFGVRDRARREFQRIVKPT